MHYLVGDIVHQSVTMSHSVFFGPSVIGRRYRANQANGRFARDRRRALYFALGRPWGMVLWGVAYGLTLGSVLGT